MSTPCLAVLGGFYGYSKFLNDLYILYIEKNKWERTPINGISLPGLAWHTSTVIKHKMYTIGGLLGEEKLNTQIFVLNLIAMNWSILDVAFGDFQPRYGHSCVEYNNRLFIFGGIGPDHKQCPFNEVWALSKTKHANEKLCRDIEKRKPQLFSMLMELASYPNLELNLKDPFKIEMEYHGPVSIPSLPDAVNLTYNIG